MSLLLSSQTKDPVTAAAIKRLQKETELTPEAIRLCEEGDLAELIKPVGFYRMKAKYLKRISVILGEEYSDDIPKSVTELVKLPGIGPKMVNDEHIPRVLKNTFVLGLFNYAMCVE